MSSIDPSIEELRNNENIKPYGHHLVMKRSRKENHYFFNNRVLQINISPIILMTSTNYIHSSIAKVINGIKIVSSLISDVI